MENTTPATERKSIRWIRLLGVAVLTWVVLLILWKLSGFEDYTPKGMPITSPPGVATAMRQIQYATMEYHVTEFKSPSSLEDLVGMRVPTQEGRITNFSIAMLEQQLGTKASTVKYFPEFRVIDDHQVPSDKIVLAYVPDSKDAKYCQVLYWGRRIKGLEWIGPERMEVARVNQKIEWLTAYKNAIESNLPPPSAPMPR